MIDSDFREPLQLQVQEDPERVPHEEDADAAQEAAEHGEPGWFCSLLLLLHALYLFMLSLFMYYLSLFMYYLLCLCITCSVYVVACLSIAISLADCLTHSL